MRQTQPLLAQLGIPQRRSCPRSAARPPLAASRRFAEIFLVYGFSSESGGLLREADYAERSQSGLPELRRRLGLPQKPPQSAAVRLPSPDNGRNGFECGAGRRAHPAVRSGKEMIESLEQARVIPQMRCNSPVIAFRRPLVELVRLPFCAANTISTACSRWPMV